MPLILLADLGLGRTELGRFDRRHRLRRVIPSEATRKRDSTLRSSNNRPYAATLFVSARGRRPAWADLHALNLLWRQLHPEAGKNGNGPTQFPLTRHVAVIY